MGRMMSINRLLSICFLLCLCSLATMALADYPRPVNNYVNDFARVLSDTEAAQLRDRLGKLERDTGIEGTVVTIISINQYGTGDDTIEAFSMRLFNKWGVGNTDKNNGFMILVAVADRRCRIELGDGWGLRYRSIMQRIVDNHMVPRFRDDAYGPGIQDAAGQMIRVLSAPANLRVEERMDMYWDMAITFLLRATFFGFVGLVCAVGYSCIRNGREGWGWLFLAFIGVLLWSKLSSTSRGGGASGSDYYGPSDGGGGFGGGSSSGGGGASGSW